MALRLTILVAAILLSLPTIADAKPRHHYRHHHHLHHARHHHPHVARGIVPGGIFSGFTGGLVERARADIGKTASQLGLRRSLWCSAYMNLITGGGTHSDLAVSWLGRPRTSAHVGAIAVVRSRRNHVGVVSGFDAHGNPIIISGNHGHRVGEGVYPRRAVIAYVQP